MSSSVHIKNKNKDILILSEAPPQGLDNTTLTAEAKYPIKFTRSVKRLILSLRYNGKIVSYLLILQKYINSKQNTWNKRLCSGFR